MNMQMDNGDKLLELAKTTNCKQTLHTLASSVNASVRRAVARNMHTLSNTLDRLSRDPVLNVSYMAVQHPNCTEKRDFLDTSNPCISCQKDERTMVCVNCPTLVEYYR